MIGREESWRITEREKERKFVLSRSSHIDLQGDKTLSFHKTPLFTTDIQIFYHNKKKNLNVHKHTLTHKLLFRLSHIIVFNDKLCI